jgi:hypothetical protein
MSLRRYVEALKGKRRAEKVVDAFAAQHVAEAAAITKAVAIK